MNSKPRLYTPHCRFREEDPARSGGLPSFRRLAGTLLERAKER
jgi:hypothetical protein